MTTIIIFFIAEGQRCQLVVLTSARTMPTVHKESKSVYDRLFKSTDLIGHLTT